MVRYKRFAPISLYIAVAAGILTAGYYYIQREFNLIDQIGLGITVIGFALFVILDPQRVRIALTGRQARYGSNALVMFLAFLGILVVINFLAYKNPQKWDLTTDKQYTLTPETIDVLNKLPANVKALAFFTQRVSSDQAKTLLDTYKVDSKGKFDYQFINPDDNPVAAQQANITKDGTVVLQMNNRQEPVTVISEEEITSALIKLANPGERVVYFLTGHGEKDPTSSDDTGYSQADSTLTSKNYTVKTINLLSTPEIPSDAKSIIIAGPQKPLSDQEVILLKDYLDKGGSLVVMEEPTPVTQFGDTADPLKDYLEKSWGIVLGNDLVVDLGANPATFALADQYGSHSITSKLQGMVTVFPTSRSVQSLNPPSDISNTVLVLTSDRSWGETDLSNLANQQVSPDQGKDLLGPVPLAIASSNTSTNARLVVIGDSDFGDNTYFSTYGNGDFLINSIDWAAQQDNLINLTPKQQTQRLLVPPQRSATALLFLGVIVALPGIVILSGISVWLQRRKRG